MFLFGANISAQTKAAEQPTAKTDLPKITQVDEITVKELFAVKKENAKPLLVNFWATWCVPCREEFPDLVEIDEEYRGKIDFITITLDDPAEINRDVPEFLTEMKAKMPTYLLYTSKENEVIGSISKDWSGGLPFTVLYNQKREITYVHQGVVKPDILKAKINELITSKTASYSFSNGVTDAGKDLASGLLIYKVQNIGGSSFRKSYIKNQKEIIIENIPFTFYYTSVLGNAKFENKRTPTKEEQYTNGYNFMSEPIIIKEIGADNLKKLIEKAKEDLPANVIELKLTVN